MTSDNPVNWALILDVLDVLERHGHTQHDIQHTGQAVGVIGDLAQVYDGTRDAPYGTYLGQARPEPAPPAPEAGPDAVTLTSAGLSTVLAALYLAAEHQRDYAATCADCADRSCWTCQSRLKDAQAYDQMAAQMYRTAQATPAADASPPGPPSPGIPPHQADPAAGREAGQ